MADILIKHLKIKAEEHSALATLHNQWGYDEKLIPKALQTIGSLFPHYSRHDESHSKQILINIERLLGENIKLLTATDTWLILEAAYWHDIGMVVPQRDLEEAIKNPEFKVYIENIRNSPRHELQNFAAKFDAKDLSKCFCGAETPIDAIDKFRQLMAEWFRQSHTIRSNSIIQAPWASVGINSPRTELIPARLYRLLGKICQMHGAKFSELISQKNGLPFREAGLAQEDCHPRFVACLLRMGDLLDLDDNRFCPVMQRIAGDNRPHLSKAHEDKHAALRHLRIDRERIEVSAECETIDGYIETYKWFDWLKKEIQDQISHWQDIVPNRELGLLPTLGDISVHLNGQLQILKDGERPQFHIDGPKVIDLIQGNNLYKTKYICIRELIQNAIDATLLHVWLINKNNFSTNEKITPYNEKINAELKARPVHIELIESQESPENCSDKIFWVLNIQDSGTGISRDDLEHILQIGGSQRNSQRQSIIRTMPEWMKPSGAFGIGLQSVFLICNEFTITTKSIFTNETLEITMHSPTGQNNGLVTIKELPTNISSKPGTSIKIKIPMDKFSEKWTYSIGDTTSIKSKFISQTDPILDQSFPFQAAKLADHISEVSQYAIIPVISKLKTTEETININSNLDIFNANNKTNEWQFIRIEDHELKFRYRIVNSPMQSKIYAYYRGQAFECNNLNINHIHAEISIDLMSGRAGSWISANRDAIIPSAIEKLKRLILLSLNESISLDISERKIPPNNPFISLFLDKAFHLYSKEFTKPIEYEKYAWLNIKVTETNSISDFLRNPSFTVGIRDSLHDVFGFDQSCDFFVDDHLTLYLLTSKWLKTPANNILIIGPEDEMEEKLSPKKENAPAKNTYRIRYKFSNKKEEPYTSNALATQLINLLNGSYGNSRFLLHCTDDRWSKLFLKNNTIARAAHVFNLPIEHKKEILLPFLFLGSNDISGKKVQCTVEQINKLCHWVQPKLIDQITIPEIQNTYNEFINYIDKEVMEPSPHKEKWAAYRNIM
jgi:hypothetical protein